MCHFNLLLIKIRSQCLNFNLFWITRSPNTWIISHMSHNLHNSRNRSHGNTRSRTWAPVHKRAPGHEWWPMSRGSYSCVVTRVLYVSLNVKVWSSTTLFMIAHEAECLINDPLSRIHLFQPSSPHATRTRIQEQRRLIGIRSDQQIVELGAVQQV